MRTNFPQESGESATAPDAVEGYLSTIAMNCLDFGPGYRVYYGREGRAIIILLGGGSKRRQDAGIASAVQRWRRYKQTEA